MDKTQKLLEIAETLLGEDGCAWDKKQSLSSLQRYVIEEAHEVVEAIDEKNFVKIKEELGDLIYNIVFISKLAEKKQQFNFADVVETICDKLIRRHPHIFKDKRKLTPEEVLSEWQEIKKTEKTQKHPLESIPPDLPLLMKAQLAVRRLKKSGLEFTDFKDLKKLDPKMPLTEERLIDMLLFLASIAEKNDLSLEDGLRRRLKQLKKTV